MEHDTVTTIQVKKFNFSKKVRIMERYQRQMNIPNWKQDDLTTSRITIVGSGLLIGSISWGLTALGVGEIFLLDDSRLTENIPSFPYLNIMSGQLAIEALAQTLCTINPHVTTHCIRLRLLYDAHMFAIPPCDVLIDATCDIQSKQICFAYGHSKNIPVIFASAGMTGGMYTVFTNDK